MKIFRNSLSHGQHFFIRSGFTLCLLTLSLLVQAQVPKTISFQGFLLDALSNPVDAPSPGLSMTFSLWDANTLGVKLWFEDLNGVVVKKGLYNVRLGESTPLNLGFDKIYYLEVKVGTDLAMTPRITLTSSAYSISGVNASNISSGAITSANIATGAVSGGVGGVIADASITSADLANGAVSGGTGGILTDLSITSADIANGAVSGGAGGTITDASITAADLANASVGGGAGGIIADGTIVDADISGSAAIADTKLATISTAGKVSGSAITSGTIGGSTIINTTGTINSGAVTATSFSGNGSSITSITSTSITDGTIVDADINSSAAIADTKLATISTAGKVSGNAITSGTIGGSTIISTSGTINSGAATATSFTGNGSAITNITSTSITDATIVDADINGSAAITDSKLATIITAGKVSNSATTATNANTANAIVARDAIGNFSAGTISAALSGNASTVTTNANLSGDVTSVGNTTAIASGVIVNADINGSAAIAGTKVSPDFGSQNVTTIGTITTSSFVGATGGVHVGNTTAPATSGNLEVDGYTKLGSTGPIIKMLKLTGTTDPTQGNEVAVAHGLTTSKILSVTALVESTTGTNYIPPGFKYVGGFEYYVYFVGVNVKVSTVAANSINVVNKPFKVLIIYEQ